VVRAAAHVNRSADHFTSAFIADSKFIFRPSSNLGGDFANYFSYPYFEIPAGVSVDKFSAYGCSAYTPIRGGGTLRRYYAFYDAGTNIAGRNYSAYFANNVGIGLENPTAKLEVSGNIVASGTLSPYSDVRLKTNIVEAGDALSLITRMNPVRYDKKHTLGDTPYEVTEIGFLAHEIKEIAPCLVKEHGDDKLQSLNYNGIVALLVKSVQEQQQSIQQLQQQINHR